MTKTHALLIRTNGTFELLDWPKQGHLKTLYTAIGCSNVAAVDITPQLTMWLDDEGINVGAPLNRAATFLYAAHRPPHQHYYGAAVITGGTTPTGITRGLTEKQTTVLVELYLTQKDVRVPAQRTK
ncbi:DUF3846 domain-containing protein [Streptomyces sp. NBC_00342]|uniref:DUF3846 domain-containing protein n=1 Tax=Streptomyces sp. NBC_00342 TaxID=2975718 RepID=UPI002E29A80D|nr:DUF3846 domain-containing protein [Streptomyces sp. NBC_00342]